MYVARKSCIHFFAPVLYDYQIFLKKIEYFLYNGNMYKNLELEEV